MNILSLCLHSFKWIFLLLVKHGKKIIKLQRNNKISDHKKLKQVKISAACLSGTAWILRYFNIIKWPVFEVDHWPPSSTEVKNKWSYTTSHPLRLHGKDNDNFTFYICVLLSLFTQTIPLFTYFLKVKPTLHLCARIIKKSNTATQKTEKYFIVNKHQWNLGRQMLLDSHLGMSAICDSYPCSHTPSIHLW